MDPITDPQRAERLARAIISDLLAYHPERVRAGIENDDLFERLADELARAQAFFRERVDADTACVTNAFGRAIVDVLMLRSRGVPSKIW